MNYRWFTLAVVLTAFPVFSTKSQIVPGQALAVANVSRTTGSLYVRNFLTIQLGYFDGDLFNGGPLFEQFHLTGSDVGKTFTLTAANDPDFSLFTQKLTNGLNDGLGITDNLDVITAKQEPEFFTLLALGNNGIDLRGFQIGSITMHVNNVIVNSPGSDPNHDGHWTDATFQGTFTVYAVPEPSVLVLLGVAGILLTRRFRFSN